MVRRNYWLKRETKDKDKEKDKERVVKKPKVVKKVTKEIDEEEDARKAAPKTYTLDELDKRIVEIVERRAGRKGALKEKKISVEDDLEALQMLFDKIKEDDIKRLEVRSYSHVYIMYFRSC